MNEVPALPFFSLQEALKVLIVRLTLFVAIHERHRE